MNAEPLEVVVPYWAKDIKEEGILTLLAFMHRINTHYGAGMYTVQTSDVNTIIGRKTMNLDKFIYKLCPEAKEWLTVKWTNIGYYEIELKPMPRSGRAMGIKQTELVQIYNERQIRVWCFLLGAFRNHLVTDDPFKASKTATMFNADTRLFKYSQYNSVNR